jgi:ABC-type multidrug transport system ATPase subunit
VIVADNIHVRFRTRMFKRPVHALKGLTLQVNDGDFFALVGQNGAGKSTAMYCFLGLLRPNTGTVQVMGQSPELGSSLYENVAYLPEEPHYHLYLTVEEATRYYSSPSIEGRSQNSKYFGRWNDWVLHSSKTFHFQSAPKG